MEIMCEGRLEKNKTENCPCPYFHYHVLTHSSLCESTSIDKDAMALKVVLVIFLITSVKYTCRTIMRVLLRVAV